MHPFRQHIEKITAVTDEEFAYIMQHMLHKKVRKHQYLIQDGDTVQYDYWIMQGSYRVFFTDDSGKEHILQFAIEDWWMSDYHAFNNQTKATVNAVCMEAGEVLCLSLHNREKLCSEMHKMEHFFRQKLTGGYIALQKRIISLLAEDSRHRYEEFARTYPQLLQRIPKKYIAAWLGVSRETLSRLYS